MLGRLHPVGLVVHDLLDGHRALGAQQPVEGDGAEQVAGGIDHEDLVEGLRQIRRLAHEVDGLPDRPERRHGDELGLHPPPGAFLRVVEGALERDALDGGQLVENLRLFLLGRLSRMVTASSESSSRTPSATVAVSSSSRISSRTASSTSVSAAKSKEEPRSSIRRWRCSGSRASRRSPSSDSWRSSTRSLQALGLGGLDGIGGGGQEFRIELALLVPERRKVAVSDPSGVRKQVLSSTSCMSPSLGGEFAGLLGAWHPLRQCAQKTFCEESVICRFLDRCGSNAKAIQVDLNPEAKVRRNKKGPR